jgi:hypothetical protein
MNSLPSTVSVPLPKHLSPGLIARLARDVVMELRALSDILEPYGISELQFARIKEMPFFKRVYEDFLLEWNRVTSTPERIRLISAVMLEEGLPRMGSQMVDKEVSPAIAIETGKFFAKIAGVGETKAEGSPGEKFVINISLGEETKLQFTKDVTPATPGSIRPPETLEGLSGSSGAAEGSSSDPGGACHQKEGSFAIRQVTEGQS